MRCTLNKYFDRGIETKSARYIQLPTAILKTTQILTLSSNCTHKSNGYVTIKFNQPNGTYPIFAKKDKHVSLSKYTKYFY